jgi:hypothetical protein
MFPLVGLRLGGRAKFHGMQCLLFLPYEAMPMLDKLTLIEY